MKNHGSQTTGTSTFWNSRAVLGYVEIVWQHIRKQETAIVQSRWFSWHTGALQTGWFYGIVLSSGSVREFFKMLFIALCLCLSANHIQRSPVWNPNAKITHQAPPEKSLAKKSCGMCTLGTLGKGRGRAWLYGIIHLP